MDDHKGFLENKLKDVSIEIAFDTFKKGMSLSIGRIFGGDAWNTPEVREASDVASDVIFTMPTFSGIRSRITEIKDYLSGTREKSLAEFERMLKEFKIGDN
ncbi:hypothetical protein [Rhizobium leguminosarum]|uniref:hypothetical protein n=1 Tax=Rhizobium leguminosarum TaxID=384 RepID=UPI0013B03A3E|nr:hypothetical protein [Rhizobium leguminosarum]